MRNIRKLKVSQEFWVQPEGQCSLERLIEIGLANKCVELQEGGENL